MVAVPPLGGAVFRLVLGPLSDRVGVKRLGQLTLAVTFVPLAWAWASGNSYVEVLGIGLLLGVAGASFSVALPLTSRWYPPEHEGLALGIAGAGNSGTVVAALAAPRIADHVGWHATFALAMIPVAAAWIVFTALAKEPPAAAGAAKAINPLRLLAENDPRWLCGFYMVTFGGFVGLSGYLPIFFVDRFDVAKATGASFAALCAVAGSLLRPVGGVLSDRYCGTRVLGVVLTVAGAAAALATVPPLAPTVALLAVLLGLVGMGNGAVFQVVGHRLPERVGAMTGLVGAAGASVASCSRWASVRSRRPPARSQPGSPSSRTWRPSWRSPSRAATGPGPFRDSLPNLERRRSRFGSERLAARRSGRTGAEVGVVVGEQAGRVVEADPGVEHPDVEVVVEV